MRRLGQRCGLWLGLAGAMLGTSPLPAGADGSGAAGVKGMTEAELRQWEQTTIGERHAAEHAELRRLQRRPGELARVARELRQAGLRARASADVAPEVGGRWNGRFNIPVMGINAAMLPTSKVLFYAYPSEPDSAPRRNLAWGVVWNPALGVADAAFKRVDPPIDPRTGQPANIWCSGTSFLADGRVLVTGGNLNYYGEPNKYSGLNQVYTFNPFDETWTRQPDMAHGRWYPTQLLMPDGRTLIIQGLDESTTGRKNPDVELFTPSPDLNGRGTITKLGSLPGNRIGDYYPHMFWMPSARALVAGPYANDSWYFSEAGRSIATSDVGDLSRNRTWGTAVLEPAGVNGSTRVLAIGGSDSVANYDNAPAVASSEVYDEAGSGGWRSAASLNVARSHHNTVLLPDGSMVTVGGGVGNDSTRNRLWTANDAQRQIELWSPQTKTWTLGPSQDEYRAYHSTALLLPDGRVLSAGDDRNGGFDRDTAELYEPPYLFKGPRPTITRAPTGVDWNADFSVGTPDANIAGAMLVAPGAVTHAVDMNQRSIPLAITGRSAGQVVLRTPPNANVALPGYHMLFLLNDRGVPSGATWVRLRSGPTEPAEPAPPPVASAAPGTAFPSVRAKIVRHKGKRRIRVVLGTSAAPRAKVKLVLRARRQRVTGSRTRTLRTGRKTIVSSPRVTRRSRRVSARVEALVLTAAPASARGRIVRRGGRRMVRVVVAGGDQATVRVRVKLLDGRGEVVRRRTRVLAADRTFVLRHPRVTAGVRSVRVRVL